MSCGSVGPPCETATSPPMPAASIAARSSTLASMRSSESAISTARSASFCGVSSFGRQVLERAGAVRGLGGDEGRARVVLNIRVGGQHDALDPCLLALVRPVAIEAIGREHRALDQGGGRACRPARPSRSTSRRRSRRAWRLARRQPAGVRRSARRDCQGRRPRRAPGAPDAAPPPCESRCARRRLPGHRRARAEGSRRRRARPRRHRHRCRKVPPI